MTETDSLVTLRRREVLEFERIVVIGGGCYGSWYTRQLLRARSAGALIVNQIMVVDRNPACQLMQLQQGGTFSVSDFTIVTQSWSEFIELWLSEREAALLRDALVPSPLMPHLLFDWLVARATQRWPGRTISVEPLQHAPSIPWQRAAPDGRHYVSFAEWMCPTNCIEPARCPATKGTRDWSMPPAIRAYVDELPEHARIDDAVLFHCVHRTYGVGMIDAAPIARADTTVQALAADRAAKILVGTVSHCHGALGVLTVS